ncbi:MAG TPA: hypothetical protein PLY94_04725 [Gemmatimonadaceae bacterium]|nr:hypothetical protein [Gemmatimonadaceae bacterium]
MSEPQDHGPTHGATLDADAALVGAGWTRRYRARFAELAQGGALLRWNSEAALTPLWGFSRRILALVWLSLLFPVIGALFAARVSLLAGFAVPTLLYVLLHGFLGDWFYYRSVRRRVARIARATAGSDGAVDAGRDAASARAASSGRVEYALLLAVALPLTAIVIVAADPRMRGVAEATVFVEVLDDDLRRLVTVQEEYFADFGRYAEAFGPWSYEPTPGVNLRILYADSSAFGADATLGGREERCFVFLGQARGMPEGAEPGAPICVLAP